MELDNYRNFLAIIEAGSFTGAADYVHIAQPALSKQLRALENYFGTKLIITTRGSRQILLTEAGRVLYQKAKYMCALEDLAKSEIENIMGGVIGTLRFSIANSAVRYSSNPPSRISVLFIPILSASFLKQASMSRHSKCLTVLPSWVF